jgi:DNA-binding response OmpR family regulator
MNGPLYRNVLVVEDDDALARVIERNLTSRGVSVRRAATVAGARAAIAVDRPDLLLLDINLPDRTGWDLLRDPATAAPRIPTIVLSGTPLKPDRVAEFKPIACLPKPFPLDALLRLVVGERAGVEAS